MHSLLLAWVRESLVSDPQGAIRKSYIVEVLSIEIRLKGSGIFEE